MRDPLPKLLRRGARCFLLVLASLLLVSSGVRGASVALSVGPEIDEDPALLGLGSGGFLVVFTRHVPRQGNKRDTDLYMTKAPSLELAGQGQWSPAVAVPQASEPDRNEREAALTRLPNGAIGLFYVSDETGTDQIFLTTSADEGESWSVPASPTRALDPTHSRRSPAAVSRGGEEILLVFEEVSPSGSALLQQTSPFGITWSDATTVTFAGRSPTLSSLPLGEVILVFEEPISSELLTKTLASGMGLSWSASESVGLADARQASLHVSWDERPAVTAAVPQGAGTWRLARSFRTGGQWEASAPLDGLVQEPVQGNPAPFVVDTGVLALAYDVRPDATLPPSSADLYFDVLVDLSCTQPPAFGGVTSVEDADPCLTGTLLVRWQPALDYGSAEVDGVRYWVYRGTSPNFAPTVPYAGPLEETLFIDDNVFPSVEYTYIVRAENLEQCPAGNGPLGGMMDTNTVRRSGRDVFPRAPSGAIRDLRVRKAAANRGWQRLDLDWSPADEAESYNLYRLDGDQPDPDGWVALFDTPETSATILAGEARLSLISVRPVSACGIEGE